MLRQTVLEDEARELYGLGNEAPSVVDAVVHETALEDKAHEN